MQENAQAKNGSAYGERMPRDREWYYDRKSRGQCVAYGCPNNCCDDSILCTSHFHRQQLAQKKYRKTYKHRIYRRLLSRKRRKEWKRLNLCVNCGSDDKKTETLCFRCSDRNIAVTRKRRDQNSPWLKKQTCSLCGKKGHKKYRHRGDPKFDRIPPSIDEFASARNSE